MPIGIEEGGIEAGARPMVGFSRARAGFRDRYTLGLAGVKNRRFEIAPGVIPSERSALCHPERAQRVEGSALRAEVQIPRLRSG
jgi:hypothetical protein